jgi:hypothetical protein
MNPPIVYTSAPTDTTYENTKARGLVQHGGPPGWLEESGPAGVILHEMAGPYRLAFPIYRTGWSDRSHPAASHKVLFMSRKEGMIRYSSRPIHAFSLYSTPCIVQRNVEELE